MLKGEKQKVVIVEDHAILRDGLKALLTSDKDLEVAGEAGDGREAIKLVEELKPNLIIMDLSMPRMNGMEAIKEIKRISKEIKIVVLTVHKNEEYILATFKAGADGYVLKDSSYNELMMAISNVLKGKHYISPEISERILEGYIEGKEKLKQKTSWEILTSREREILKLIAEGYRNKDIAEELCISVKTVEKHRSNIMEKLNLHNAQALTAFAIDHGLVTRD